MIKKFKQKALISALSVATLSTISTISHTSDVEIYKAAEQGTANILLMLDTSGSMGISSLVLPKDNVYGSPGDVKSSICKHELVPEYVPNRNMIFPEWQYDAVDYRENVTVNGVPNQKSPTYGKTTFYNEVKIGDEYIPYYMRGCTIDDSKNNNQTHDESNIQYDRLSKLKSAILNLLASSELSATTRIGLANFSARTDVNIFDFGLKLVDGHSGAILVPVAELDIAQRQRIAKRLAEFVSLDTTTNELGNKINGQYVGNLGRFNGYASQLGLTNNVFSPEVLSYKRVSSGTPTAHAYAEAAAYMMGTGTGVRTGSDADKWRVFLNSIKSVKYVYDGYAIIRSGAINGATDIPAELRDYENKTAYFLCVEAARNADGTLRNGGTGGWNNAKYGGTVSQCLNIWQGRGGEGAGNPNRVEEITDGNGNKRYKFKGLRIRKEDGTIVENFYSPASDPNEIYDSSAVAQWQAWMAVVDMPEGSRMITDASAGSVGGWIRVKHEPMDIEPIVGSIFYRNEIRALGLFVYRANPFSLLGNDAGSKGRSTLTANDMVGGMDYSVADSKESEGKYKQGGSRNGCDGNGIYFLTDGAPNSTVDEMARTIMNHSLTPNYSISSKPTGGLVSPALKANLFAGETGGWEYIGEYAKRIRNPQTNPAQMTIKTAVVGFGSAFESAANGTCADATNADAKNACLWGSDQYGGGGFYYANNAEDIKNSIIRFVDSVSTTIDPVSTGSPFIPANSFNPTEAPKEAYYGSFTPKPNEGTQIWLGDMNKYRLDNSRDLVDQEGVKLFANGKLNNLAKGIWKNGSVLEQLPLQKDTSDSSQFARTVYTDRKLNGLINKEGVNSSDANLQKVDADSLFNGALKNDPDKNYWLNILGYDVDTKTDIKFSDLDKYTGSVLRQLGSVMHSTPVLLTQEGTLNTVREIVDGRYTGKRVVESTGRKDYLMYGSTQGLLHVVDANTGKEKFAFIPNEIMNTQKDALLNEGKTLGGVNNLFYGIDAPWTAYTQYAVKSSDTIQGNTLTVNSADHRYKESSTQEGLSDAAVQWVYGGMRMGGRSYYALDLTDIEQPKLRFHIDPKTKTIYANGKEKTYDALSYMGQSWSKPTIATIKWHGVSKLVMIVGGGYDSGYEDPAYDQQNKVGAGIYMFDAANGDLLWWASANANDTTSTSSDSDFVQTKVNDLQYSVVSQINAIDRNNDGYVDHLYFGDLGGQAFRVDIDNSAEKSGSVIKRVERLFTEHKTDGTSPRFYEMPSVSAYNYDEQTRVIAAFQSGNRSSPLAGINHTNSNTTVTTASALDAVYAVYDYNVVRHDLYTVSAEDYAKWPTPTIWGVYNQEFGTPFNRETTRGWKYVYNATPGQIKGLGTLTTLGNFLYANGYNKDEYEKNITKCSAEVLGSTTPYRFCLPTGKCEQQLHGYTRTGDVAGTPVTGTPRVGISAPSFGGGSTTSSSTVGITGQGSVDCEKNPSHISCQTVDLSGAIRQLRWYEKN